jgi:hypothetical protein
MKKHILNLILLIVSNNLFCQIIDSVVYKPMINVDSIKYWHKFDNVKGRNIYITYGYYQYCNCDYDKFLKVHDYKSMRKIVTSEGEINNGIKTGTWIYYNNVIGDCCDESILYPDTTLIYKNGRVIKRTDNKAEYVYLDNDSVYVVPFVVNTVCKFKILCDNTKCQIRYNHDLILKYIDKSNLIDEIDKIRFGIYDRECRIKLQQETKR